jgi:DNA-3-methyladenine glycosylase II
MGKIQGVSCSKRAAVEAAIRHLTSADPILSAIITEVGPYRLQSRKPTFETLARSIVYQQVSGKAAASIFARLKTAAGPRFSAKGVLRLTPEELRACGLSAQKAAYIRDLAGRVAARQINFRRLFELNDEEIIESLTQVKGVGVWTVQMFLMFALERPNVFPLSDLGIRNAIQRAYNLPEPPKPADMLRISACWHPYCSVASWYLWRSLDGQAIL